MDWRNINFDWNRARAFLVTAEEGSLSAAARALGQTQPTLGRQVEALEQELGVALFDRAGRGLVLTPAGMELLDYVRAMAEAAGRLSLAATGQAQTIEGEIAISAGEAVAAHILPPIIAALRRAHPGIEVEIVASNAASDLGRREADIAIRNFRPEQPDLVARRVADAPARLYAAPAYLDLIGHPVTPGELSRADFIGFDRGPQLMEALNRLGLSLAPDNFPVVSASQLVQWEMVKAGVGIGIMDTAVGAREPAVAAVLPDRLPPIPIETWLTAHREVRTNRRVRLVFDLLAEALGKAASGGENPAKKMG